MTHKVRLSKQEAGKDPRSTEDPGISQAYVETVLKHLLEVPEEIQKTTLKAIINSLLKDMKKYDFMSQVGFPKNLEGKRQTDHFQEFSR